MSVDFEHCTADKEASDVIAAEIQAAREVKFSINRDPNALARTPEANLFALIGVITNKATEVHTDKARAIYEESINLLVAECAARGYIQ